LPLGYTTAAIRMFLQYGNKKIIINRRTRSKSGLDAAAAAAQKKNYSRLG
jgi:hypothetical protein